MQIKTERLLLRGMERRDAPELRRIVTLSDVGRMLFIFPPDWSLAGAEGFIDAWAFQGSAPFRLAVIEDGRFLGTVGVGGGEEPDVFYFLDPNVAGRGIATEAMRAFAHELFQCFEMPALRADVFTDNPASARVLEKIGFHKTGEGSCHSAARLEPAPIWHYRLTQNNLKAA